MDTGCVEADAAQDKQEAEDKEAEEPNDQKVIVLAAEPIADAAAGHVKAAAEEEEEAAEEEFAGTEIESSTKG